MLICIWESPGKKCTWKGISKQIGQDWSSKHMLQPGLGSIITCFGSFILEFQ